MTQNKRVSTATKNFGTGKREGHDASAFYARFSAPTISNDQDLERSTRRNEIIHGDARDMSSLADNSVALVVTSPPYFVGKEYEMALGEGAVPATYLAYLKLLRDVFAECARVLEPGGRIAVNIANLGRKPYRSLSADVTRILQDELGLLLRGEVLWRKAAGASGSCAWGSFKSAANPVLRDVTERVVIASKGRFDRALSRKKREQLGLPFENTISKEEFMAATLDVWDIAPESAKRVGHPAPFPVALPKRLIELYTYRGDLVLDPFFGAGTTGLAAKASERDYLGFELDEAYIELAQRRIDSVE
jgi:site-specific DNA-methyltransferase (adenine-specific)